MKEAYERLADVSIDNQAYPKGFLRRIASTDCEHTSCDECGYCARVAERVLRIGGHPVSDYRAPGPGQPTRLLSWIRNVPQERPTSGPGTPVAAGGVAAHPLTSRTEDLRSRNDLGV